MRILQVHCHYRETGGEDVAVAQEAALLRAAGHELEQVLVENPRTTAASARDLALAPWNPRAARRVVDTAERFRPDVVHVHNTWFGISPAVFAALRAAGYPVVATLHNYRTACATGVLLRQGAVCELCVGSHPGHAVVHGCYRGSRLLSVPAALTVAVARRRGVWRRDVRRFFVPEEASGPRLVAGGIPPNLVVVHPHFVEDPGPRPHPPSASGEVVFAGRLSPEKGAHVLLQAWRKAAPPGLTLTVYGDGPQRSALEALAGPNVVFAGHTARTAVASHLQCARALVFPSTCLESGLAPVEALANGTPVVASNLVGMAPRVTAVGAGWSSRAGDVTDLARSLGQLGHDDDVDAAGRAARRLYEVRHTPAAALRQLEETYQSVTSPRG